MAKRRDGSETVMAITISDRQPDPADAGAGPAFIVTAFHKIHKDISGRYVRHPL